MYAIRIYYGPVADGDFTVARWFPDVASATVRARGALSGGSASAVEIVRGLGTIDPTGESVHTGGYETVQWVR